MVMFWSVAGSIAVWSGIKYIIYTFLDHTKFI